MRFSKVIAIVSLVAFGGAARAQETTFTPGSLILPLDSSYSRPSFMNDAEIDYVIAPDSQSAMNCNADSEKDDGISIGRDSIGVPRLDRCGAACCGLKFSGR